MADLNDEKTVIEEFNSTLDEIWSETVRLSISPPFDLQRCATIRWPSVVTAYPSSMVKKLLIRYATAFKFSNVQVTLVINMSLISTLMIDFHDVNDSSVLHDLDYENLFLQDFPAKGG